MLPDFVIFWIKLNRKQAGILKSLCLLLFIAFEIYLEASCSGSLVLMVKAFTWKIITLWSIVEVVFCSGYRVHSVPSPPSCSLPCLPSSLGAFLLSSSTLQWLPSSLGILWLPSSLGIHTTEFTCFFLFGYRVASFTELLWLPSFFGNRVPLVTEQATGTR